MDSKQSMQRRDFLSQVAAGGTAGLVAAGSLQSFAGTAVAGDSRMFRLTADDFAPFVGDAFVLERGSDSRFSARLVEARPLESAGPRPGLPRRQAFSLVFRADSGAKLEQETHLVRHRELGTLAMLLVPVGSRQGDQRLEAVFN